MLGTTSSPSESGTKHVEAVAGFSSSSSDELITSGL